MSENIIISLKYGKAWLPPYLLSKTIQARPGGVVGYQYTRYFAPKIPVYLKIVKCVILNT